MLLVDPKTSEYIQVDTALPAEHRELDTATRKNEDRISTQRCVGIEFLPAARLRRMGIHRLTGSKIPPQPRQCGLPGSSLPVGRGVSWSIGVLYPGILCRANSDWPPSESQGRDIGVHTHLRMLGDGKRRRLPYAKLCETPGSQRQIVIAIPIATRLIKNTRFGRNAAGAYSSYHPRGHR